ncbi:hypothetical protein EV182_007408 [Spiromyces aspiralis]|uniref:Uncharacterized protein n=1 Tax=Spiromyces aspiralis TaxID=68401 RepID=A0ACC1H8T5_9FUNG|nr:hypothetical protein EV182_007408 [Spiromyces aspiralis]
MYQQPHSAKSLGYETPDDGNWAIVNFFRNEFLHPAKVPGNLNVLYGTAVFAGAIAFLRNFGDMLVA